LTLSLQLCFVLYHCEDFFWLNLNFYTVYVSKTFYFQLYWFCRLFIFRYFFFLVSIDRVGGIDYFFKIDYVAVWSMWGATRMSLLQNPKFGRTSVIMDRPLRRKLEGSDRITGKTGSGGMSDPTVICISEASVCRLRHHGFSQFHGVLSPIRVVSGSIIMEQMKRILQERRLIYYLLPRR
jgi:hypothetical protein